MGEEKNTFKGKFDSLVIGQKLIIINNSTDHGFQQGDEVTVSGHFNEVAINASNDVGEWWYLLREDFKLKT